MSDLRFASMRRALLAVSRGQRSLLDVVGLTPQDIPSFLRAGSHALDHKDPLSAIAAGTIAVALDPICVDGWLLIAMGNAEQDRSAQAIAAYERVLSLTPGHMRALVDLAELQLTELHFEAAAPLLKQAIAQDPKASTPLGLRAQLLVVQTLQKYEVS